MRFFSLPIILLAMTPLWACSSPGGSASGSKQESSAGSTGLLASTSIPSADYEKVRSRVCIGNQEFMAEFQRDPLGAAATEIELEVYKKLEPIVPSNRAADYKDTLKFLTIWRDLGAQYGKFSKTWFADPRYDEVLELNDAVQRFLRFFKSVCP